MSEPLKPCPRGETPHYWAVVLTHERIDYGLILESSPEVLDALKKAIFKAAKEVIAEAMLADAPQANQQENQQ